MSSDRIRLSVAEARRHSELALMGLGYEAEEAAIIADHAIDAALCGYEYSGLAKLLNIPEHRQFKLPRRKMTILRETPVSTQCDRPLQHRARYRTHSARHHAGADDLLLRSSGNRDEVFAGGYSYYPDNPTRVWTADEIEKSVFYYQIELNDRFFKVVT